MAGSRSLGVLTLDMIMKLGGFIAGMDQAERRMKSGSKSISASAVAIGTSIGTFMTRAIETFARSIPAVINRMDELSKASQKIGLPTEELSRLAYAADLSDVSLEQLQGGLAKLTKYQAEAAQGGKEAIKTFEAFGISIKDNEGHLRATQSVLLDFAQVFASLPDGPEKTALALRVFGKAGAELIPLLNSGSKGLREMGEEADRLGVTISTQAGKQAELFNDNITRLQAQMKGFATDVAEKVLPELIHLTEALRGAGKEAEGFNFGDLVANEMNSASKAIRGTVVEIEYLKKAWKEQGLFGEGILTVLDKAGKEFERRESLSAGLEIHRGPGSRGTARKGAALGHQDLVDRETADAAKKLLATTQETTHATKGKSDADKAAEEAARRHAEAMDDLREAIEKTEKANLDFTTQVDDMVAKLGGPLAEAALQYKRDLAELRTLAQDGEVGDKRLAEAEAALAEQYGKTTAEIQKRLDTGGAQLQQMQQELDLLNLQTEAERVRAAFLIDNPTATGDQADAAVRLHQQIDETRKAIAATDEMRASFEDAFVAFADGSMSGIDALKAFADAFVQQMLRMAAAKASSALFGEQGTTGGGLIGGLLSAFFGGGSSTSGISSVLASGSATGYAGGTDYHPGGMAWVGEKGPELVNLPRGAQVIPADKSARMAGGNSTTIQINLHGDTNRDTAQQIANAVRRQLVFSGRS